MPFATIVGVLLQLSSATLECDNTLAIPPNRNLVEVEMTQLEAAVEEAVHSRGVQGAAFVQVIHIGETGLTSGLIAWVYPPKEDEEYGAIATLAYTPSLGDDSRHNLTFISETVQALEELGLSSESASCMLRSLQELSV